MLRHNPLVFFFSFVFQTFFHSHPTLGKDSVSFNIFFIDCFHPNQTYAYISLVKPRCVWRPELLVFNHFILLFYYPWLFVSRGCQGVSLHNVGTWRHFVRMVDDLYCTLASNNCAHLWIFMLAVCITCTVMWRACSKVPVHVEFYSLTIERPEFIQLNWGLTG